MGNADQLGRHNDLVGVFADLVQIDKAAAVVQDDSNLQKQTVMLCHVLLALDRIENLQCRIFHIFAVIPAVIIACCRASRRMNDILQKAVCRRDAFLTLRKVGSHAFTESDTGQPHLLRTGLLKNIMIDHRCRKQERCLIDRGI